MGNSNHFRLLVILLTVLQEHVLGTTGERSRRSFGEYDLFGNSRQSAFDEINRNQNVALWSAQSAVTSSVGQDYGQQLANLALSAHQFTVPVTNSKGGISEKNSETRKHNSDQDAKENHNDEASKQDDHASNPKPVVKGSHRVVRKPEKTRWVGIRSRPNRKGRRIPSNPKKQSCSNS